MIIDFDQFDQFWSLEFDFNRFPSIYFKDIDFVRGTKAKKKTETISKEKMTNGYPKTKKLEFISFFIFSSKLRARNLESVIKNNFKKL